MSFSRALLTFGHRNNVQHILLISGDEITFGRDASNDVRLFLAPLEEPLFQTATADISRQHFKIRRRGTSYTIQDLSSTNGTSLNCIGLVSNEQLLQNNQIIDVGGVLEMKIHIRNNNLWLRRLTNLPQDSYLLVALEGVTLGNQPDCSLMIATEYQDVFRASIQYNNTNWLVVNQSETPIMVDQKPLLCSKEYLLGQGSDIVFGHELLLFQVEKTSP